MFAHSWQIFSFDFKHVIISRLDELLGLLYMVGKLEMSSFQNNLNRSKVPPIAPNISQTVHKDLV
jgi:hypothetical protein